MSRIEVRSLSKAYPVDVAETARSFMGLVLGRGLDLKRRGTTLALDNVSFSVESGERVGIIGANGAGKSTLLHLIAGIAAPSDGAIEVDGHVTSVLTLGIGIREEVSGRENIYLDGELHGKSRRQVDEVIDEIVAFADIGEFIDRPVRTYSTGMKSRLAFAIVTHIDPDILLIDEALSVGDAQFSVKASGRIRDMCGKGKIVILVSHRLEAINEVCSRCLWLERGQIKMDGSPEEVTRTYARAVHESDDRQLAQEFRSLTVSEELIRGFAIPELTVEGGPGRRGPLAAEEGLIANIGVRSEMPNGALQIRLTVERIDGLLLLEERRALENLGNRMQVVFPPGLAAGLYNLSVELLLSGRRAASRSTVFELVSAERPAGGRPALVHPYSICVDPVAGS